MMPTHCGQHLLFVKYGLLYHGYLINSQNGSQLNENIPGQTISKRDYEEFKVRINGFVAMALKVPEEGWTMQDGTPWPGNNVKDHPGMIQMFLGNNGVLDVEGNEVPRLVYVSREKRPGFEHHKKASATNSLIRVSAIYMKGLGGIQGSIYVGIGSVFRRQALYGYDAPVTKKALGKSTVYQNGVAAVLHQERRPIKGSLRRMRRRQREWRLRHKSMHLKILRKELKISSYACLVFVAMFSSIAITSILEMQWGGVGIDSLWRNEQFWVIGGASSHRFSLFQGLLKVLAGVNTIFTVTSKGDNGEFLELYLFKWTTLLIINIVGVLVGISDAITNGYKSSGPLFGKLFFAIWVILHLYRRNDGEAIWSPYYSYSMVNSFGVNLLTFMGTSSGALIDSHVLWIGRVESSKFDC